MTEQSVIPGAEVPSREERMAWWHDAKFGMFVHWGCCSVLGRGEQILLRDLMPVDEYRVLADDFNPPLDWADNIVATSNSMGVLQFSVVPLTSVYSTSRSSIILSPLFISTAPEQQPVSRFPF